MITFNFKVKDKTNLLIKFSLEMKRMSTVIKKATKQLQISFKIYIVLSSIVKVINIKGLSPFLIYLQSKWI